MRGGMPAGRRPALVPDREGSGRRSRAKVTVDVDELGEGDIVAVPCPFDQPRPHERYSSGARSGASPQQMVAAREKFITYFGEATSWTRAEYLTAPKS